MAKVTIYIAAAFLFAIAIILAGPLISFAFNGQNIVATSDSAATYVGTSVGFLGAIASASVAFLAYELRKRDEKSQKARACAILVKTAIRPAMMEMKDLFIVGLEVIDKGEREKFVNGGFDRALVVSNSDIGSLFIDRWGKVSSTLALSNEAADALSHLDNDAAARLLRAQSFWEQVRGRAGTGMCDLRNFAVAAFCTKVALDELLKLNHALNLIAMPNESENPAITSVAFYLQEESKFLPV